MRLLKYATTAASLASTSAFSFSNAAFAARHPSLIRHSAVPPFVAIIPCQTQPISASYKRSTRLYFSNKGEEGNFLTRAISKVKSFFSPKEDVPKTQERQLTRSESDMNSSMNQLLKDAPFGMRMLGKMISPILSNMAGDLAEEMDKQSRSMQDMMQEAQYLILDDERVVNALGGEPIQIGLKTSQSSSTIIVNGEKRINLQAVFQILGGRNSGTVSVTSRNGAIERLVVGVAGRSYNVNISGGTRVSSSSRNPAYVETATGTSLGKNAKRRGDTVIDAEVIEKK